MGIKKDGVGQEADNMSDDIGDGMQKATTGDLPTSGSDEVSTGDTDKSIVSESEASSADAKKPLGVEDGPEKMKQPKRSQTKKGKPSETKPTGFGDLESTLLVITILAGLTVILFRQGRQSQAASVLKSAINPNVSSVKVPRSIT
jgi:hypothetical protein